MLDYSRVHSPRPPPQDSKAPCKRSSWELCHLHSHDCPSDIADLEQCARDAQLRMTKTSPQTAGASVGRVGENSAPGEAMRAVWSEVWLVEIPPTPESARMSRVWGMKD